MYRRLEGLTFFDCPIEIFLDKKRGFFPMINILTGFIDDETGAIRLFGSFVPVSFDDLPGLDGKVDVHYIVFYINNWRSENGVYTKPQDIETIEDVLKVEWIYPIYQIYFPEEREDFNALMERYETQEV